MYSISIVLYVLSIYVYILPLLLSPRFLEKIYTVASLYFGGKWDWFLLYCFSLRSIRRGWQFKKIPLPVVGRGISSQCIILGGLIVYSTRFFLVYFLFLYKLSACSILPFPSRLVPESIDFLLFLL